jgi:hypothetical protein
MTKRRERARTLDNDLGVGTGYYKTNRTVFIQFLIHHTLF